MARLSPLFIGSDFGDCPLPLPIESMTSNDFYADVDRTFFSFHNFPAMMQLFVPLTRDIKTYSPYERAARLVLACSRLRKLFQKGIALRPKDLSGQQDRLFSSPHSPIMGSHFGATNLNLGDRVCDHITVACRGNFYIVDCISEYSIASLSELLNEICHESDKIARLQNPGLNLSGYYDRWIRWRNFLKMANSRKELAHVYAIESSLFLLSLNDDKDAIRTCNPIWVSESTQMAPNRWNSICMQVAVYKNSESVLIFNHHTVDTNFVITAATKISKMSRQIRDRKRQMPKPVRYHRIDFDDMSDVRLPKVENFYEAGRWYHYIPALQSIKSFGLSRFSFLTSIYFLTYFKIHGVIPFVFQYIDTLNKSRLRILPMNCKPIHEFVAGWTNRTPSENLLRHLVEFSKILYERVVIANQHRPIYFPSLVDHLTAKDHLVFGGYIPQVADHETLPIGLICHWSVKAHSHYWAPFGDDYISLWGNYPDEMATAYFENVDSVLNLLFGTLFQHGKRTSWRIRVTCPLELPLTLELAANITCIRDIAEKFYRHFGLTSFKMAANFNNVPVNFNDDVAKRGIAKFDGSDVLHFYC